jgi:hypothetical protein
MDFGKLFSNRYQRYMVDNICDRLIKECNEKFDYQFYDQDKIVSKVITIEPYPEIYIKLNLC